MAKKRSSEEFIMLNISWNALWRTLTFEAQAKKRFRTDFFYRRFAELLDILLNGADVKIAETGSRSK